MIKFPTNAFRVTCSFLMLMTMTSVASAQTASALVPPVPVPVHDSFTIASKHVGEKRLINVHVPAGYATSRTTKYPVLYMPDGGIDEDFVHVVKTVDSLIAAKAIRPVIVVGIPNTERRRDMTGPTRIASDSAIAKQVGGSYAFRQFVRDELFPEINKRYRTTTERSIIGESLAGLFVVETFLLQPDMFTHYIALDASMWWNAHALADSSSNYIAKFDAKPHTLYLANSDIKDFGDGVHTLNAKLKAAQPRALRWTYVERLDLVHSTIFLGVQVEALIHALR